uniref:Uncharacterized protein n=1 Tax=viral metagenome TaxID=1070528 RepID=A0A6C0EK68_9ZZZZ
MGCSECGSDSVNKSTCPLVLKNPKPEHWAKHPKARAMLKPKAPNPPPQFKPKAPQFNIKPRPSIAPAPHNIKPTQLYKNPYKDMARNVCMYTEKTKKINLLQGKIIITGEQLDGLRIKVKNPSKLILKLTNSPKFVNKLREYMDLLCDIYKRIGELRVTNVQFFMSPDSKTKYVVDMVASVSALFIDFLIENIYPSGGTRSSIDINMPIEDIIEAEEIKIDELRLELNSLPAVPTYLPPIAGQKGKERVKEKVV